MRARPLAFATLLIAASNAEAQTVLPRADPLGTFSLSIENDAFLGGSDRYYTNGLQLAWRSSSANLPRPLDSLNQRLNWLLGPGQLRWGLAVGHNIFTPADTLRQNPDPNDRPYAGYLYGAVSLARDTGDSATLLELQLGLVGPSALGEEVQNTFHDLIGDTSARGWDYQLKDEPVFALLGSRTWRVPLPSGRLETELLPNATVSLGTVQTYAGVGGVLRLGQGLTADYGPPRIRPALAGSAFFEPGPEGRGWYVFAGAEARAIARDIFLDGNTWRDSRSVDRRPLVADLQVGAAVYWHGIRLTYTQVWRTEEFYGQRGGFQLFGSLSIGFRF